MTLGSQRMEVSFGQVLPAPSSALLKSPLPGKSKAKNILNHTGLPPPHYRSRWSFNATLIPGAAARLLLGPGTAPPLGCSQLQLHGAETSSRHGDCKHFTVTRLLLVNLTQ